MSALLLLGLLQADPIIALLEHKEPAERAAAARTLGSLHVRQAVPPLIERLKDESPEVQKAAHEALLKITGVHTLSPAYDEWKAWWTQEGMALFAKNPEGQTAVINQVIDEQQKIREQYRDMLNLYKWSIFMVAFLWLAFIIAAFYAAAHISSKLKEWKEVMKQAEHYLRKGEEVTQRTDRIIDELEAKKTEIMDFFAKLKEDNQGELERFTDLLEQNTEHRIRLEVMALRQKAEKELEQTLGELKATVDHEIRRAVNEGLLKAEQQLERRQQQFLQQIDVHSLFLEATFYGSQGRNEEALRIYKRLLEIRPDHHVAWTKMGNALRDLLRFDEALEAHRRAQELVPNDSTVHYNTALTYACMKRKESMLAELAKAFESNGEELKDEALNDPTFKPYWNDPAFKNLAEG
jgi:tetratricopeptide (TPR) repeat protein